jgi:hypothetical protein
MSDEQSLQFDRAEFEQAPSTAQCAECRRTLTGSYFEVNGQTVCEACRYTIESRMAAGSSLGRFARATGAGFVAALLGAALYYAIRELTGYELGLIAIVVGFGVGSAVRWGSNGRGGWKYQTLAIALTYFAIAANYVPTIIAELNKMPDQTTADDASEPPAAATAQPAAATTDTAPAAPAPASGTVAAGAASPVLGLVLVFALALALPFLGGFDNIIGLVIIAIGLYEAWKLNRRTEVTITGPHMIGRPPQAPAGV